MKAILIDRNNTEAFIALEDGSVITIPLSQVSNISIGDNIHFSKNNTYLVNNTSPNVNLGNDKLLDFF